MIKYRILATRNAGISHYTYKIQQHLFLGVWVPVTRGEVFLSLTDAKEAMELLQKYPEDSKIIG